MLLHLKGCTREVLCNNVKVPKVDQTWRSYINIFVKGKYCLFAFVALIAHSASVLQSFHCPLLQTRPDEFSV